MQTFKHFLNLLNEETFKFDYHHTSAVKIKPKEHSANEDPMWFSHSREEADKWHSNAMLNHGSAYTYSAKINGKIAHHTDPEVQAIFKKHNIDQDEYHADLVSNPEYDEVHAHEGTQLLKKYGYAGYTHPDYDPADSQKDQDSTLVFHRKDAQLKLKKSN